MPLRIVIFTTAQLTSFNDVLFRRLAADPELEVAAIVCDCLPWRTQSFGKRLKKNGAGYLWFKLVQEIRAWRERRFWAWVERELPALEGPPDCKRLGEAIGVPVLRSPDIHSAETLEYIRGLNADIGIICGGRIIRESVLALPRMGTLNIHKRKVPDYRGGGAIGYWEILNGEREIGVTIHQAVAKVDEGAVLAQRMIPIEPFDNPQSLQAKASIIGNELYHETLRKVARGEAQPLAQDLTRGKTYRGAGEYAEAKLLNGIKRREAAALDALGRGTDFHTRPLQWLKLRLALPALRRRKQELVTQGQAPIIVLFFHRIANDAATPGTVGFDEFVAMMLWLRRHVRVISLEEAERRLAGGRNDEMAAVITFDDGYAADLDSSLLLLNYLGIPATWFISVGNTLEGKAYPHDARRGITTARPMTVEELKGLPNENIAVGSHCYLHEDCGQLTGEPLRAAIVDSRTKLEEVIGRPVRTFAFPKGIKGINIKREGWELAAGTYNTVCSAYSGYNFPKDGAKHIKRWGNPFTPAGLVPILLGFTGLGDWRRGNAWTWNSSGEAPY